MTATKALNALTQPCSAQHHPCSEYLEQAQLARESGRQDEAFILGERYRECIRSRPALPFDPSILR
jgi:hypothetical protein